MSTKAPLGTAAREREALRLRERDGEPGCRSSRQLPLCAALNSLFGRPGECRGELLDERIRRGPGAELAAGAFGDGVDVPAAGALLRPAAHDLDLDVRRVRAFEGVDPGQQLLRREAKLRADLLELRVRVLAGVEAAQGRREDRLSGQLGGSPFDDGGGGFIRLRPALSTLVRNNWFEIEQTVGELTIRRGERAKAVRAANT
jgi:hypothetical protein